MPEAVCYLDIVENGYQGSLEAKNEKHDALSIFSPQQPWPMELGHPHRIRGYYSNH